ncbi:hypothetical protein BG004_006160 [Podila humilis]|nr:hypothetical protein BG004_006160 [Podila humilis]
MASPVLGHASGGISAPPRLLATCPCLNVKLHLAKEPSPETPLIATETQLGLAGVSVEQKILSSMSISGDKATIYCNNCNNIVYTYPTSTNTVQLEPTSLAFLNNTVQYSPSDGIVVPSEYIVYGDSISALLEDARYSKAFRLVLTPPSSSTAASASAAADESSSSPFDNGDPSITTKATADDSNNNNRHLYYPHLERVRTILDKELEANLAAQQQQTEARIEAYKSQQLFALQESIASTRREKEQLWLMIQDRVRVPPPPSSVGDTSGNFGTPGMKLDSPLENGGTHPFDVPSTLPIRLTSASRLDVLHGSLLDRRKSGVAEMAMSHQFREFDQRMASNSMRRQSLVPGINAPPPAVLSPSQMLAPSAAAQDQALLSSSHASIGSGVSHESAGSTSSPAPKSKKRVTIVETVSIVEPDTNQYDAVEDDESGTNIFSRNNRYHDDTYDDDDEDDDEEEEEEEGVVFDLDEELGFDDEEGGDKPERESDDDLEDDTRTHLNGGEASNRSGSAGINISVNRASLPKSSGLIVGSLRANYLRRQKGLEQHKKSSAFDEDDEDDDDDFDDVIDQPMAHFGTSLPIQIQARPPNIPPPPARTSAIASSLAMPPGSSPAAAMLQRRLSRVYGNDASLTESRPPTTTTTATTTTQRSGSVSNLASSLAQEASSFLIPGAGLHGTVIIDPLMLLEEEHDADESEDRLRKHRQRFSAINHRRDLEQQQQQLEAPAGVTTTTTITSTTTNTLTSTAAENNNYNNNVASFSQPLARSAQADFEPPHIYSARTYVGSTPWEMPTRITVHSGGYQREGTHLDKQIAFEMAQEQEKERKEQQREAAAREESRSRSRSRSRSLSPPHPHHHSHLQGRHVDKIEEGEEEVDEEEEDREAEKRSKAAS